LQKRAAAEGFEWPDLDGVLAKLNEELDEVRAELARREAERNEIGELVDKLYTLLAYRDSR
jgi:ATP diphosphatase